MQRVQTIIGAQRYIEKLINEEGYTQNIMKGEFAGESTYRKQLRQVALVIEEPTNYFDKPDSISKYHIDDYIQTLINPKNDTPADYTYGERIMQQYGYVIEMLRHTPDTNQAIIEIGQPTDVHLIHMPCFRLLHFMYYDGKVNLTVFARSNDIGNAFLMNMYGFAGLLEIACLMAGRVPGEMTYFSSGAHLYFFPEV